MPRQGGVAADAGGDRIEGKRHVVQGRGRGDDATARRDEPGAAKLLGGSCWRIVAIASAAMPRPRHVTRLARSSLTSSGRTPGSAQLVRRSIAGIADFDVMRRRPDWLTRISILARQGLQQFHEAERDLTMPRSRRPDAQYCARIQNGSVTGMAGARLPNRLKTPPTDGKSWISRGYYLAGDPKQRSPISNRRCASIRVRSMRCRTRRTFWPRSLARINRLSKRSIGRLSSIPIL